MEKACTAFSCLTIIALYASCGKAAEALNILQFGLGLSQSHVLFSSRLASTMSKSGHNVTLLLSPSLPGIKLDQIDSEVEVLTFQSKIAQAYANSSDRMILGALFKESMGMSQVFRMAVWATTLFRESCEVMAEDAKLNDMLRIRRYDVIFSHCMDLCAFGITKQTQMANIVCYSSVPSILDYTTLMVHVTFNPSYNPHMMSGYSDRMTFIQRLKNTGAYLTSNIYIRFPGTLIPSQLRYFSDRMKRTSLGIDDLATGSAIMMNGEQNLDFTRPVNSMMWYLGDVGGLSTKVLSSDWIRLIDASEAGFVIFSMGSVMKDFAIPVNVKKAFLDAFVKFPQYTFFLKMSNEQLIDRQPLPANVHFFDWLPQRELLRNPKARLFITHAGYNSLLESAMAGVPMLLISIFGDQHGNAARAVRHGIGLTLDKQNITTDTVANKIRQILFNKTYSERSQRLARILKDKIISSEELLLNIAKKFSRHDYQSVLPKWRQLNFFAYLSMDVIAVIYSVGLGAILLCSK